MAHRDVGDPPPHRARTPGGDPATDRGRPPKRRPPDKPGRTLKTGDPGPTHLAMSPSGHARPTRRRRPGPDDPPPIPAGAARWPSSCSSSACSARLISAVDVVARRTGQQPQGLPRRGRRRHVHAGHPAAARRNFVATLRTVLTMHPSLTPTQFGQWYGRLQGDQRQVGGIGSAVIDVVARNLRRFQVRRDADPEFNPAAGASLPSSPRPASRSTACSARAARCSRSPRSPPGSSSRTGATRGRSSAPARRRRCGPRPQPTVCCCTPINVAWLHTTLFESPFYRRGVALRDPRRAHRQHAGLGGQLLRRRHAPCAGDRPPPGSRRPPAVRQSRRPGRGGRHRREGHRRVDLSGRS